MKILLPLSTSKAYVFPGICAEFTFEEIILKVLGKSLWIKVSSYGVCEREGRMEKRRKTSHYLKKSPKLLYMRHTSVNTFLKVEITVYIKPSNV